VITVPVAEVVMLEMRHMAELEHEVAVAKLEHESALAKVTEASRLECGTYPNLNANPCGRSDRSAAA
jgi:hypothetical protein